MAKQVSYIEVTIKADVSGALPHETLDLTAGNLRYVVCDTTDAELMKGKSNIAVDTIVGADTVSTWFGKVVQQVKDAEGIA